MKKSIIISILMLFSLSFAGDIFNQPFDYFFKSRPIPTMNSNNLAKLGLSKAATSVLDSLMMPGIWEFKPTITIPAFKVTRSDSGTPNKPNISTLTSTGFGVTYERDIVKKSPTDTSNYAQMSVSVMILVNDRSILKEPLNLSPAIVLGCLNNHLQAGIGYDFSTKTAQNPIANNQRLYGLLTYGVNITLNKIKAQ
jgi:hypothetical protein